MSSVATSIEQCGSPPLQSEQVLKAGQGRTLTRRNSIPTPCRASLGEEGRGSKRGYETSCMLEPAETHKQKRRRAANEGPPIVPSKEQIEYYFSDANIRGDQYLQSRMDDNGWVSLSDICNFPRMRRLGTTMAAAAQCLKGSLVVEVSSSGHHVRKRSDELRWGPESLVSVQCTRMDDNGGVWGVPAEYGADTFAYLPPGCAGGIVPDQDKFLSELRQGLRKTFVAEVRTIETVSAADALGSFWTLLVVDRRGKVVQAIKEDPQTMSSKQQPAKPWTQHSPALQDTGIAARLPIAPSHAAAAHGMQPVCFAKALMPALHFPPGTMNLNTVLESCASKGAMSSYSKSAMTSCSKSGAASRVSFSKTGAANRLMALQVKASGPLMQRPLTSFAWEHGLQIPELKSPPSQIQAEKSDRMLESAKHMLESLVATLPGRKVPSPCSPPHSSLEVQSPSRLSPGSSPRSSVAALMGASQTSPCSSPRSLKGAQSTSPASRYTCSDLALSSPRTLSAKTSPCTSRSGASPGSPLVQARSASPCSPCSSRTVFGSPTTDLEPQSPEDVSPHSPALRDDTPSTRLLESPGSDLCSDDYCLLESHEASCCRLLESPTSDLCSDDSSNMTSYASEHSSDMDGLMPPSSPNSEQAPDDFMGA